MIWFRRDLRIQDNAALFRACQAASRNESGGVVALFAVTPQQWKEHDDANMKVGFWLRGLVSLKESLAKLNIPLLIVTVGEYHELPRAIGNLAKRHACHAVFVNREYEVNEVQRDDCVEVEVKKRGIEFQRFHDRVIVPPDEVKTKEEKFYTVFTPFRRVWDTRAASTAEPYPRPKPQVDTGIKSSEIPERLRGFDFSAAREDLWPAGEDEALRRLKRFSAKITEYDQNRDIPSVNGTSTLSPYLAAGNLSPRQCFAAAIRASDGDLETNQGAKTWVSELTWRDFYAAVLVGFPRVSKHLPFKLATRSVRWRDDENDFSAWCEGRTGYPIVDAGMRQLNRTGWMHNRLRMVTAMFLTKHLLIDWRMGERYFMRKLIDGDLAANNGGWQWSASTGTDAVPYFRIFNPFSQSKRFDPEGKFIKKMCPELDAVKPKSLHDLKKLRESIDDQGLPYPQYVVDYSEGRQRALDEFKRAKP